ncbi:Zinc finger protein 8 [Amphibalanus amphitrite]|uniref:Zinc finger protein 8 n=1 Tax=Amphibalanus amphitrite TaxID=1232801 RepID=A0A6A4WW19_AMPAM|nr:Zinc finger protein 8 [Amphibalanus amphitrite]
MTKRGGSTVDARRGTFRCEFCGRIYNHLVSLGQHMKLHKGDTTCHVCGKVLSRTTQLRIHLRQIHGL